MDIDDQQNASDQSTIAVALYASTVLAPILERWDSFKLKNVWLVAGSIAQTVWNQKYGMAPETGIADVDLVYFDPGDLSASTEHGHSKRIQACFGDIPMWLDVKNEARVRLWYEEKFGFPIPPYGSVPDAIKTFPTTATSVGVRPSHGSLEFCAPFGLSDLMSGIVRANKTLITKEIFEAKANKWRKIWPELVVVGWDE